MPNKPNEFPKFTPLDSADTERIMGKIPQYLHNIASVLGISNLNDLLVDQEALYEIITRVEMRRVYFHIYHPIEMGEINEGALICFWILKLMPFKHDTISSAVLNTKIAYTIFINMLFYVAAKTKKKVNIKSDLMTNTLYAFRYRDLSKEAIMALAESLLY
jgi:hypothetical protein